MKNLLSLIFSVSFLSCVAQQQSLNIIPAPAKAEMKQGSFSITSSTKIIAKASGTDNSIKFLNGYLKKYYGFELKVSKNKPGENTIDLNLTGHNDSISGAYTMNVGENSISIEGNDVLHKSQTAWQYSNVILQTHHVLLTVGYILIAAVIFSLLISSSNTLIL